MPCASLCVLVQLGWEAFSDMFFSLAFWAATTYCTPRRIGSRRCSSSPAGTVTTRFVLSFFLLLIDIHPRSHQFIHLSLFLSSSVQISRTRTTIVSSSSLHFC
uniref:Uncharacterized protein n=1 Tax=Arundo donax TaxID=35708 RepID=A0A0A9E1Z4_ARUDO